MEVKKTFANKLRSAILLLLFAATTQAVAQPLSANAGTNTSMCLGAPITIGGSPSASFGSPPYTYSWAPSSGLSSSTVANPTANPTTTTTYTLTVTDAVANTASAAIIVNVNPIPNVIPTPSSQTICHNSSAGISLGSSVGGTAFAWTVSQSGVSGATSGSTAAIVDFLSTTAAVSGTATYTITPTSGAGCVGTPTTVVVTVNPAPAMTSSGTVSMCSGTTLNHTLTSNISATYVWGATDNVNTTGESTTNQTGSTINNTITSTAPTTTNVSYTVQPTSLAGCPGSFYPITVTVNSIPIINATPSSVTICSGSTANITFNSSIAGTTYNYTVSQSGVTGGFASGGAIAQTLTTTGGVPGTATYTVTGVAAGCASTPINPVVTVNPTPTVSVNSPTICAGSSAVLTAAPSIGGGTFSWSPGGQTTSSISVSPGTTTTYTCSYTKSGCTGIGSGTVTVNPLPTATASNSGPVCAGTTLNLTAATVAGATYSWAGPSGFSSAVQNPSIPGVTPANAGTYTLTVTKSGCSNSGTTNVTVTNLPLVNAGIDQTVCIGDVVAFSASAPGAITYLWDFGDAGTSTVLNPTHTYVAAGTYTATLTVTGSTGCTNSDVVQIIIAPAPTLTPTSTDVTCFGACDGTAAVSAAGGFAPWTYLWSPGGQTTSSVSGLCAGSYTVSVTNNAGCGSTSIYTINQPPMLAVSFSTVDVNCNGTCNGSITATATGGTSSYNYDWLPGTPMGDGTAMIINLCVGIYTLRVTDTGGCILMASDTVTEPAVFGINAGIDQNICLGDTTTLVGIATGGILPYTYNWNDGTTGYPVQTLLTSPLVTTTYTLTATDASGCIANDNMTVTVLPNTNIYGHVTYSGGSITTGTNTAVLFSYVPFMTSFDTVTTASIDAGGNYYFPSVDPGDYLIKVFTDTAAYPMVIATYFGDEYLWDSATVVTHDCSANSVTNIAMIEVPAMSGPGHIDGTVTEGDGFGRAPGDPIPGVDIKLGRNPGGQLVSSTQTDASGQYSFDNVPSSIAGENYVIYVDIPGLERITLYSFVVDPLTQYYDMDYEADSSTVYTTQTSVGITNNFKTDNSFRIYPNPAKENITVKYTLKEEAKVSISIYNLLGVKVSEPFSGNQSAGESTYLISIAEHKLATGVYFITLTTGEETSVQRLVITE
jgi:hypothetical protein